MAEATGQKTDLEKDPGPLVAPIAKDGFVVDFDPEIDSVTDIKGFFDRYGFVVIRNVLTDEEADSTLEEFWKRGEDKGLSRENPNTWAEYFDRQRFGHLGIMGLGPDLESLRQLENRQNPRVAQAFSLILGTDDLWIDHDRLGVMRPTKGRETWEANERLSATHQHAPRNLAQSH